MTNHQPVVSIVTPSYNQAEYLEETILSVLSQDYPNIEYTIIDGGSTDGSVDIIKKYEHRLAYWVSESDHGQSHAINKGWQSATGEVIAYLNSDDLYTPGAVTAAVAALASHPDSCMVYSDGLRIDARGRGIGVHTSGPFDVCRVMTTELTLRQPTVFIRRQVLDQVGLLDERLHLVMDYELWIRLGLRFRATYVPGVHFAKLREHATAKSTVAVDGFLLERQHVLDALFSRHDLPDQVRRFRHHAIASVDFWHAMHAAYAGRPDQIRAPFWRALIHSPGYVARRPFSLFLLARMLVPWGQGRPTPEEWASIDRIIASLRGARAT